MCLGFFSEAIMGKLFTPYVYKFFNFCDQTAKLIRACYQDGNTCWIVECGGEVIGKLSVNIPCIHLDEKEFCVHGEEEKYLAPILEAAGVFEPTGREVPMGFVTASIWKLREGASQ